MAAALSLDLAEAKIRLMWLLTVWLLSTRALAISGLVMPRAIIASGLGVLASAARQAAARGASLHAVCAGRQFQRLFIITGLDRHIPLARSVTEAYQNLTAAREIRVNGLREHAPHRGSSLP